METIQETMTEKPHSYDRDICIVGAGHIGLPWAATLAVNGFDVCCIDTDEQRVTSINNGFTPFDEPKLTEYLEEGIETGNLVATTDPSAITSTKAVAFTLNASLDSMESYLDIIGKYAQEITSDQTIINRTTLPIQIIERTVSRIASKLGILRDNLNYVTFPERLAEGKAIEEIETLPKIIGASTVEAREVMSWLTKPFGGAVHETDKRTAMFVKLIDNTYRDATFAIANQFAMTAAELDLDAHAAIEMANEGYPRNNIPSPGPVGGKCLTKDPKFVTDDSIGSSGETPDLFAHTRRVNQAYEHYVAERILEYRPKSVAILGTSYKQDVGDEYGSPALNIRKELAENGVEVSCFDPHVEERDDFEGTIVDSDIVLVAVNHTYFKRRNKRIPELAEGLVIDLWNILDPTENVVRLGESNAEPATVLSQD